MIVESAFKTAATSTFDGTTVNISWLPLELSADNAFQVDWAPDQEPLRTALARNRVQRHLGSTSSLTGSLQTLLYPAQDNLLLGWGFTRNDMGGGGTADDVPWTTTEPARDLASVTFVGYAEDDSLNAEKYRFNGCKCNRMSVSAARGTMQGAVMVSADFTGSERASSADTEPARSLYPATAPYNLSDCTLTVNGSVIANYESFTITVENEVEAMKDNRTFAQPIRGYGRTLSLEITQLYKNSPDLLALYTGKTEFATTLVLTHPTAPTVTFNFQASCRILPYTRQYPLAGRHTEGYTIVPQYNLTNGTDLAITFT
jgi:hypothetical protein